MRKEVAESHRYAGHFSLVILNVDFFSQINRRYGYATGDRVLEAVAQKVVETVRLSDLVSRFGGDEIAALLPKTDADGAWILAERVREAVVVLGIRTPEGIDVPTVISAGVAELRPEESVEALERRARKALQDAKDAGRNRCFRAGDQDVPDSAVLAKGVAHRKEAFYDSVQALAAVVEARDGYTHSHSRAVGEYAYRLAKKVGFEGDRLETFKLAATLHDLGKIGVPDSILKKPGPLTDDEWTVMQRHPAIGRQIIGHTFHLGELIPAMYYHHERWDGRGYPEGLKAEEIPIEARIVTIADAYGAMVDDRPYRKGLGHETASKILQKAAGLQFDPNLVTLFIQIISEEEMGGRAVSDPATTT
jgi:diguanylate cyclase (GGDEF)-like protein